MSEANWMYLIAGAFVIILVANMIVFTRNNDPEFKKKYSKLAEAALTLPLPIMFSVQFWPSPMVVLGFVAWGLIVFLNFKLTKFCDACGKFRYNRQWFEPMRYCSVCGQKLDD